MKIKGTYNRSPLISVIVPVYNAGKYLPSCLDSIIGQTYRNTEILLIDDGSTDGSGDVCEIYAEKDRRIRVYHTVNRGVCSAKNTALDRAEGEYVIFIDADDYWMDTHILGTLVDFSVRNDLDLVRGEYIAVDDAGDTLYQRKITDREKSVGHVLVDSGKFLVSAVAGEFFMPLILFRSSVLSGIRFEIGKIFLEDMSFLSRVLTRHCRCMYLPDVCFYAYRKNESSVSAQTNPKKLADSFAMCRFFHELYQEASDEITRRFFQTYSIKMYYYTLQTIAEDMYYHSRSTIVRDNSLSDLGKDVKKWMSDYGIWYASPIYHISPMTGVYLFRLRLIAARIKNRLKQLLMS